MKLTNIVPLLISLILLALIASCSDQQEDPPPVELPAADETATVVAPAEPTEEATATVTAELIEEPTDPATAEPPAPTSAPTDDPPPAAVQPEDPWWNDAVFYEVFVRSFQDSDGDGVGDINGLIERLDYLNDGDPETSDDLGVTGIWLMPIMESPSYHGYDVVDYTMIDEEYGTEEDFRRLIEEANARGIKVIVDLVMNHTGRDHPWFQESLDPDSAYRDWYVWADENPGFRGPQGQRVWHAAGDDYYYGLFWDGMPDLNYENPDVTAEMYEITRYWLEDMGVDGFRLDAIKHMIEDGANQQNTPATHAWLAEFYTFYKGVNPDAFSVGEAWTGTQQVVDYTGDEVDIPITIRTGSCHRCAATKRRPKWRPRSC
jgi:pullulanase/glycogen debranching enzyme